MTTRRDLIRILSAAAALATFGPVRLGSPQGPGKRLEPLPIGGGLVVVDGWILKADEAAAVLA